MLWKSDLGATNLEGLPPPGPVTGGAEGEQLATE